MSEKPSSECAGLAWQVRERGPGERLMCWEVFCERVRIWQRYSFYSKHLRREVQDVGELEVNGPEGIMAAESKWRESN